MSAFSLQNATVIINCDDFLTKCDSYYKMRRLLQIATVHTRNHKSIIDLFPANQPLSFKKPGLLRLEPVTGILDLLFFFLISLYSLKPKIICYRNHKKFKKKLFVRDFENSNFAVNSDDPQENYVNLCDTFSKVVQKHAPVIKKILRENHTPFINRKLRKGIHKRSRLRNNFWKDPSKENELLFKT